MNRTKLMVSVGVLTLTAFATVQFGHAAEAKPKYTTKEVMKTLHKGDTSVGKRVGAGNGTKEDFAKMVDYYGALPANKPPKGDDASWKAKTTALLDSAKALNAGKPGALEAFKKASNCKACHSVHKED